MKEFLAHPYLQLNTNHQQISEINFKSKIKHFEIFNKNFKIDLI